MTLAIVRIIVVLLAMASSSRAIAEPSVPTRDDEVVEHLPTRLIGLPRLNDAATRPAAAPPTGRAGEAYALVAATRGERLLDEARDRGDPRYAGYALAAIAPWKSAAAPPVPIALLAATLAQYQHDFDGSRKTLEAIVARSPGQPQAMLTLATIARVQGRYADSDRACNGVPVDVYRVACLAENDALRGRYDDARRTVDDLLQRMSARGGTEGVQRWLLTTAAELEERAGNDAAAEADYRRALGLGRDSYLTLDFVDLLLAHGKAGEAAALLRKEPQPFGDGVLLRLAIAQKALGAPDAPALASEMRERFDAARERGDAISIHGRELARELYALQGDPRAAVVVARQNLAIQKEPADFVVMAEAARSAGDRAALAEAASQAKAIGLVDSRLAKIVDAQR